MESLPADALNYIFSKSSINAKDVASCKCVSKKWENSMTYLKSLSFPHNIFDNLKNGQTPDDVVTQMLSSISQLEELLVHCVFTNNGLASWMKLVGSSLKNLDLRVDDCNLEFIQAARNLESLRLLNVSMVCDPKWDVFQKLQSLEIYSKIEDLAFLTTTLRATPNLNKLVLRVIGLRNVNIQIELLKLQHCTLLWAPLARCSLMLRSPKIEYLEVEGFSQIIVPETNCLNNLSITSEVGSLDVVDFGKLMTLETLFVRGVQFRFDTINKILQPANGLKHLIMLWDKDSDCIEFTRGFQGKKVDFVDFFKSHPKLESFNIECGLFPILCPKSLKNVDSSFVIPCLEEVMITFLWPLKAKRKMSTIESLLKYGKKLKKMEIKIHLTESAPETAADDILEEINRILIHISSCSTTRFQVFQHSTCSTTPPFKLFQYCTPINHASNSFHHSTTKLHLIRTTDSN